MTTKFRVYSSYSLRDLHKKGQTDGHGLIDSAVDADQEYI